MDSSSVDPQQLARFKPFYEHYCPGELPFLHVVLSSYKGREDALWDKLVKKYGPYPPPGASDKAPSPQPSVQPSAQPPSAQHSKHTTPQATPVATPKGSVLPTPQRSRAGSQASQQAAVPRTGSVQSGKPPPTPQAPPSASSPSKVPSQPVPGTPSGAPVPLSHQGSRASLKESAKGGSEPPLSRRGSAVSADRGVEGRISRTSSRRSEGIVPSEAPVAQYSAFENAVPPSVQGSAPPSAIVTPQDVPVPVPEATYSNVAPPATPISHIPPVSQTPEVHEDSQLHADVARLQEALRLKEEELAAAQREAESCRKELNTLNKRAAKSADAERIRQLNAELATKNSTIAQNAEELRVKDRQIAALEAHRQQSGMNERTQALLQAAHKEVVQLRAAVTQKEEHIAQLTSQLEAAHAAILSAISTGFEHDVKLHQARAALQCLANKPHKKKRPSKERREADQAPVAPFPTDQPCVSPSPPPAAADYLYRSPSPTQPDTGFIHSPRTPFSPLNVRGIELQHRQISPPHRRPDVIASGYPYDGRLQTPAA